jgi:hypothetical protein
MRITEEDLLNELRRFRRNSRLILHPDDLPAGITLPSKWSSVVSAPFGTSKVVDWREWDTIANKVPTIGYFLERNLLFNSVCLDERADILHLLYVYTSLDSDIYFYAGRPPVVDIPRKVAGIWTHFPPELREFYLTLHNGWTFLPSNSNGPSALDDCAFISEDQFDFTDEKAAEAAFDASKVLTLFHNGAGDYLCLNLADINPEGEASAMIWWHEEPAKPDFVDFWPALDAWIGISFEDADYDQYLSRGGLPPRQ